MRDFPDERNTTAHNGMKVLLVSSIYPPTIGGPAPHTQQIAREWARTGFAVDVCVPQQEQPIAPEHEFALTVMPAKARSGLLGKLQRWAGYATTLHRLIRQKRPEFCVMMVFGGPLAFVTGLICRLHGVPAIVKLTGEKSFEAASERDALSGGKGKRDSQCRPGLQDVFLTRLFRAVWATSPHFAERLERAYGLPKHRIFYQPNFIDCSRFEAVRHDRPSKLGGTVSLLSVSRLRSWKGIETCLHAAAQFKDIPFHWEFVGSGQEVYVASLKRLVRELGLEDRVSFHGEVPPNRIHEHYRKAGLFVLLSDYEPFGIVLLEAMAAGVPIVASRTGGIPSVTDGDSAASLVEPGNPVMAAGAIRSLLQNSEKRSTQVQRGLDRLKEFSVDAGCLRLAEFGRALARPVTPRRETLPAETGDVGVRAA